MKKEKDFGPNSSKGEGADVATLRSSSSNAIQHIGKRTGINFSKHEVIETKHEDFCVYYLRKPDTICDSIKYINTNGILAVTGDYGNWIFCREFHPNAREGVSDGYWKEKLRIASTQEPDEFDSERTKAELIRMINTGAEEYGYRGDELTKAIGYFKECLEYVDEHELDYTHFAYRNVPDFIDSESVVFIKKTKYWLDAVFDGFDEMCKRIKAKTELQNPERSVATESASTPTADPIKEDSK